MRAFSVNAWLFSVVPTVGKYQRLTSFGTKVKDGVESIFDVENLSTMVENFGSRKNDLALCYDHQSAYVAQNGQPAPALGWFDSLALIVDGELVVFASHSGAEPPDPAGLENGVYGRLSEITPLGEKLLPNYRFISPMFTDEGADEEGNALGYDLLDCAVTNTPFQDGVGLTFHRMGFSPSGPGGLHEADAEDKKTMPVEHGKFGSGEYACIHCGQRFTAAQLDDTKIPAHKDPSKGSACGGAGGHPGDAQHYVMGMTAQFSEAQIRQLKVGDTVEWKSGLSSGRGKVVRLIGADPAGDHYSPKALLDSGDAVTPADQIVSVNGQRMSKPTGTSSAPTGVKKMSEDLYKKLGLADGASADELKGAMSKYMADQEEAAKKIADDAEIAKMADGDEDAAKMAKDGEPDEDDKKALSQMAKELGIDQASKPKAILAAYAAKTAPVSDLASVRAELNALRAERDEEKKAALESQYSKLADRGIAAGYAGKRENLIAFARSSMKDAQDFVEGLPGAKAMQRMTVGGAPLGEARPVDEPVMASIGGVKVPVKQATFAAKARAYAKEHKVSLRDAQKAVISDPISAADFLDQ